MIPKSMYTSAPVVSRENPRGVWAEGVTTSRQDEITFDHAVTSFGFLIPPNRRITGDQWVALIQRNYSMSEPRVAEVVNVISRVMLVDQFVDDYILFDKDAHAIYRGTMDECVSFFDGPRPSVVRTRDCSADDLYDANVAVKLNYLSGAFPEGEFAYVPDPSEREDLIYSGRARSVIDIGLPNGYVYKLPEGGDIKSCLFARVADMLRVHPVGVDGFTLEQNKDVKAVTALLSMLSNLDGHTALVTSRPGQWTPRAEAKKGQESTGRLTEDQIESSMLDFVESLKDCGWDGSSRVFLTRPAPCHNALWSMRQHESYVQNGLIGWRIPQGYVEHALQTISHSSDDRLTAQHQGERA